MWSGGRPCTAPAALSGEVSGPQELCAAKGVCAFHVAEAIEPRGMAAASQARCHHAALAPVTSQRASHKRVLPGVAFGSVATAVRW